MTTFIVVCGTYLDLPPFSSVIALNDSIKDKAARFYGEPPYGHAELSSLKTFTMKMNLNIEDSLTKLRNSGIKVVSDQQTLQEIAAMNLISPKDVHELMTPFQSGVSTKNFLKHRLQGLAGESLLISATSIT